MFACWQVDQVKGRRWNVRVVFACWGTVSHLYLESKTDFEVINLCGEVNGD